MGSARNAANSSAGSSSGSIASSRVSVVRRTTAAASRARRVIRSSPSMYRPANSSTIGTSAASSADSPGRSASAAAASWSESGCPRVARCAECAPQRCEEAAFGGLELAAVEDDHHRTPSARVDGGRLEEHRLADTRDAVDDGNQRCVALDELKQRGPLALASDERAGALIERRLQRARRHRPGGESTAPRSGRPAARGHSAGGPFTGVA